MHAVLLRFSLILLLFAAPVLAQGTNPLGATINKNGTNVTGVTFRVWAPNATGVAVRGQFNNWGETAMTKDNATGYWSATLSSARPGQEYKYFLRWAGNTDGTWKHDPRVVSIRNGNSLIYDHSAFDWGTTSRPDIPVDRQVMYELHIGSFYDPNPHDSQPGTFDDAIVRLDYLQRLGVNVIALMPVNEFGGAFSWGYNPEHLFAVESSYGGPDGLKRFVKAAHARGMKVQLDVVHNHWNAPGDGLWEFDGANNIYFYPDNPQGWTAWGRRPNFSQPEVRRFIRENINTLLDDFRVDGFRWDSPQNILGYDINGTKTIVDGKEEYTIGNPQTILPDGKSMLTEINRLIHEQYTGRWSIAEDADLLTVRPQGSGYPTGSFLDLLRVDQVADSFDGHWQTSFHNEITPEIASASPNVGKIRAKVSGWSEPPGYRVIFTDNHDKSGSLNNETRLANRMDPLDPEGKTARRKTLLNAVLTLTAPGTPMLWMGQEFHATGPFTDSVPLDWRRAFAQHRIFRAHRDLVQLRGTLPALQNSDLADAPGGIDEANDIYVYWRRNPGVPSDDLVIFMNFSGQDRSNVNVSFPSSGNWHVRMNTDWRVYGDDFGNFGPGGSVRVDNGSAPLGIAAHSAIILARTAPPAGFSFDDADLNGLPDGWESMAGVSDASADPDGDGITNLAEFRRMSDPLLIDRVSLIGSRSPLTWDPNNTSTRMTWSDERQRWEWVGSVSGAYQFKFVSGSVYYGTGSGIPANTASPSGSGNLSTTLAVNRYRFAFDEVTGAYSISAFPVSTEWWETNALPAPLPTSSSDPRWDHDPNGDGFSHRLEYALGGSPVAANSSGLTSSWPTNVGGTSRLVLQWLQRTNGGASLGIAPVVSTSLANTSTNWTTNGVTVTTNVNQFNVPAGFQRREASVPMDGAAKFLRLRVTGP